jgi:Nucleotide-diphospho-sugar transferase
VPNLLSFDNYDMMFMDDGARTPRFAPFFTNTGFYFVRHNERTLYFHERLLRTPGEIIYTGSHQATFIRHLTEAHYLIGLQVLVLDDNDYPSGQMYHHQPEYVGRVKRYETIPYVWHMCWTPSRDKKVEHLKDIGLWYLPPTEYRNGMCENGVKMLQHIKQDHVQDAKDIKHSCCVVGDYWSKRPAHINVEAGALTIG